MDIVRKVFAPDACPVHEGCVDKPGLRRLLRFDTVTMNMGDSDFSAGVPDTSNPQFVWDPCHRRMREHPALLRQC